MSSETETDLLIKYLTETFKNNKIIDMTGIEVEDETLYDRKTIMICRRTIENEEIFKQQSEKYSSNIDYFVFHGSKMLALTKDFLEVTIRKFIASDTLKCNNCDEEDSIETIYCPSCGFLVCKNCKKRCKSCPQCKNIY